MEQNLFRGIEVGTRRIGLRALSVDDVDPLHAIVSREEVVEFLPESVMSREETERIVEWLIECYDRNTVERIYKFTTAIVHRTTDRLIGWCGLGPLDFDESKIELYFGVAPEHWGKGVATEAGSLMLEYGFHRLGLDRIAAVVKARNVASKRVLEKLGMVYRTTLTGMKPEHAFYEGSLYYDLARVQNRRS